METKVKKTKNSDTISVVGRRKEAVARVRISVGAGELAVNGKPIAEYFLGALYQKKYQRPIEVTKTEGKYNISAKVVGGGVVSQVDAFVHGVARAIAKIDPSLRTLLKKDGLLTRDARVKERRKYGNAQKARAKKQSPKR